MIELPRSAARQFRAMLRQSLMDGRPRHAWPPVLARAGHGVLTLHSCRDGLGVRFRTDAAGPEAVLAFGADVLAQFEGRTADAVTIEPAGRGRARAHWDDGGRTMVAEFDTLKPDAVQSFPEPPRQLAPMPEGFAAALAEAVHTAAVSANAKVALTRLLLRGGTGDLVASDSKQLLVQGGFGFPWQGDVLIPRLPALAGREVAAAVPVGVGRTEAHVFVRAGPWEFALPVDTASRFPDFAAVIPRPQAVTSRLRLDAADRAALLAALPKLPGADDEHAPVTLDLGQPPAVRAQAGTGGKVAEVVLTQSTVTGPPVRVVTGRNHLRRALALGFGEVEVVRPEKPLACRDANRTYVWMPLDGAAAVSPTRRVRREPDPEEPKPRTRPTRPTGRAGLLRDLFGSFRGLVGVVRRQRERESCW